MAVSFLVILFGGIAGVLIGAVIVFAIAMLLKRSNRSVDAYK